MNRVKLTDPFTGITFDAIEYPNGDIVASHPLAHMEIKLRYDAELNSFLIPAIWFEHVQIDTYQQAAELLNVSYQRVFALVKSGMLQAHMLPNGDKVILHDDVMEYNANRKYGRPRKGNADA